MFLYAATLCDQLRQLHLEIERKKNVDVKNVYFTLAIVTRNFTFIEVVHLTFYMVIAIISETGGVVIVNSCRTVLQSFILIYLVLFC